MCKMIFLHTHMRKDEADVQVVMITYLPATVKQLADEGFFKYFPENNNVNCLRPSGMFKIAIFTSRNKNKTRVKVTENEEL